VYTKLLERRLLPFLSELIAVAFAERGRRWAGCGSPLKESEVVRLRIRGDSLAVLMANLMGWNLVDVR